MSKKSSRVGKKQIRKFQFLKIKTSVAKIPIMNAVCPFTSDEITVAKKCLLNKWEKPLDYDKRKQRYELELKKTVGGSLEHKDSFYSTEKCEKEEKYSEESKKEPEDNTKQQEAKEAKEEEEDKQETAAVEPKNRAAGGLWLEATDLAHCFQYLLVFHNPRAYASKICHKDLWTNANESFIPNEGRHYVVLKPENKSEIDAGKLAMINEEFKDLPVDLDHDKTKVLVTFAPNGCLRKESEPATNYFCSILNVSLASDTIEPCATNKTEQLFNV